MTDIDASVNLTVSFSLALLTLPHVLYLAFMSPSIIILSSPLPWICLMVFAELPPVAFELAYKPATYLSLSILTLIDYSNCFLSSDRRDICSGSEGSPPGFVLTAVPALYVESPAFKGSIWSTVPPEHILSNIGLSSARVSHKTTMSGFTSLINLRSSFSRVVTLFKFQAKRLVIFFHLVALSGALVLS